jgi:predicted amino acid racemase
MRQWPRLLINLRKLAMNGQKIAIHCLQTGIGLTAVVKAVAGDQRVVTSLIESGIRSIGDSRFENLRKFRFGSGIERMLLRLPSLSQIHAVLDFSDTSLHAESVCLENLSLAARLRSQVHQVLLMVDLGERREGVMPDQIVELAKSCRNLAGIRVVGLGANFSCFAGVQPSPAKLNELIKWAKMLQNDFQLPITRISGGNSSSLPLLFQGLIPPEVNHLRIGEGILLGRETLSGSSLPGLANDAFLVEAEVVQASWKPDLPDGLMTHNALGSSAYLTKPNRDDGFCVLVNLGRQDTPLQDLTPLDPDLRVLGGSSDYIVLASSRHHPVGRIVQFLPDYWSLLALMTSPYVMKEYVL